MRKFILTLVVAALTVGTHAQSCKYKMDGVDKATGKQTRVTKSKMVFIAPFKYDAKVSFQKVDSDYSVIWIMEYSAGGGSKVANKDAELIFVLQDGTEVKLKRGDEKETYPITKEQMDSLLKSKVSSMRYYYTNVKTNEYTNHPFYQATDSEANDIQEIVKCITI